MTNWMTAAGLALIAGGLATLISFRSVLFGGGGGERRPGRRQRRALEAPQRRPALPASSDPVVPAPAPPMDDAVELPDEPVEAAEFEAAAAPGRRRDRRGRRRAMAAEPYVIQGREEGGLESIGFAAEMYEEEDVFPPEPEPVADEPEVAPVEEPEPEPVPVRTVDRSARGYGDRVDGWVRPEYQEQRVEPRAGEYWTPIPVDLAHDPEPSAKGFGWPMPVERLPAVPDYEPATGFDLPPVPTEPTEAMMPWGEPGDGRAGRIRLPRSWQNRNEKTEPRRRPRPRPRPTPEPPPVDSSTVYVSRHAADPPR